MSALHGEESRVDFAGIQALSSRSAGYAVAEKCLEVQAEAEKRDPSLRTTKGVKLADDAWSWFTGAMGEIAVGKMLAELGPEWFVRHAVPIGAGTKDVDHLVIGPAGVFAINTKHHADASVWIGDRVLRVNHGNTWHLRDALRDRDDVTQRLTAKAGFAVQATPVLAIYRPASIIDARPSDARPVSVIDAQKLVGWLRGRPRRLSPTEVSLLQIAAEEPETWHVDARAADTLRVMQRFERLVSLVGTPDKPVAPPREAAAGKSASPVRPTRGRVQPAGRTSGASFRPRASRARASTPVSNKNRAPRFVELLKVWLFLGVMLAAMTFAGAYMGRPCDGATACAMVPIYQMLTPWLGLANLAIIGIGVFATLGWLVGRVTRRA